MKPATYILSNLSGDVLYTGVTANLAQRMHDHRNRISPNSFTCRYNVTRLVFYEFHDRIVDAIDREKMIKKKSRRGKVILIESMNPGWRDLLDDI